MSEIFRAAESCEAKGGYNTYTRNCTTFAKEMLVDVAKIKGAAGVFAKDEVYLPAAADAQMFGAGALAPITKANMENAFDKISQRDDLDYQNFGNKMVSKEDHERYRKSLKSFSRRITMADSPNAAAENLKRSEGGRSGSIGIFTPVEMNGQKHTHAPIAMVFQQMIPMVSDLKTELINITPLDRLTNDKMTDELKELMDDLNGQKIFTDLVNILPFQDDDLVREKVKQSDLMRARTYMTDTIKKLNTLLFRYYRNDKRVHKRVMSIINMLNHGIYLVDGAYIQTDEKDQTAEDSELKNLINDYDGKEYSFTYNGKQVPMTPSEYEAWLQVCKTPQKALEKYSRYMELKEKDEDDTLSPQEEKEFEKLDRLSGLADDFERSHKYMMTREKFNQQDVDYVFSLAKKERQGGVESEMFEQEWNDPTMAKMKNPSASAAGTYQMMIMKEVFGGMKDRFTEKFKDAYPEREMLDWLTADIVECMKNHKKEMTAIIRGMKHTTEEPDDRKLQADFSTILTKWLFQLFHDDKDVKQYRNMVKTLTSRNGAVIKEADKIITSVLRGEKKQSGCMADERSRASKGPGFIVFRRQPAACRNNGQSGVYKRWRRMPERLTL